MNTRKLHNPKRLTPGQYGVKEGYRLLFEDEVESGGPLLREIEILSGSRTPRWSRWTCGGGSGCTYRTKVSPEELAALRKPPVQPAPATNSETYFVVDSVYPYSKIVMATSGIPELFLPAFRTRQAALDWSKGVGEIKEFTTNKLA